MTTSPILMGLLLFFESGSSADLPVSLGTVLERPSLPHQKEVLHAHEPKVVTTRGAQTTVNAYPNAGRAAALRQGSTVVPKPSFDCKKARSWSEKAVCNDSNVAKLDVQMAKLYRTTRAKVSGSQRKTLKNAQLAWLRKRERCNGAADASRCLVRVYKTRIVELAAATPAGQGPASTHDAER